MARTTGEPWKSCCLVLLSIILLLCITKFCLASESGLRGSSLDAIHLELLSQIEDGSNFIKPINVSATNLARFLRCLPVAIPWSSSTLENKVAHSLFTFYSVVPHLSQVSYFREDGLFFSYSREGNKTFALFSNVTHFSSDGYQALPDAYKWFYQQVDSSTGVPIREAVARVPDIYWKTDWFCSAVKRKTDHAFWMFGWSITHEPLFLCVARVKHSYSSGKNGIVSFGIPANILSKFLQMPDLQGIEGFLYTEDRDLVVRYQSHNSNAGYMNLTPELASNLHPLDLYSNRSNQRFGSLDADTQGRTYTIHVAPVNVFEVPLVSAIAFPRRRFPLLTLKPRNQKGVIEISFPVFVVIIVVTIISTIMFCICGCCTLKRKRKETILQSNLIKQIEATRQAERKSMNKTLAFASTSHDLRTILSAIFGLIEHSLDSSREDEVCMNLREMKSLAVKLLGLLDSVLDTSKIEAGKMQLQEAEFDLIKVLEESVDMFSHAASEKGLEVILDLCDDSVLKNRLVKGDSGRIQQILNNLISNAVKFTPKGHVVVRARAKEAQRRVVLLSFNQCKKIAGLFQFPPKWFCQHNKNDPELRPACIDEKSIDVVLEVEDTGKGIPKEKRKSVFENFVQVKESDSNVQNGVGLGLGIVQSLVRLMGGEISIIDKDPGERGTCFRFNVIVKASGNSQLEIEENGQTLLDQLHHQNATIGMHQLGSDISALPNVSQFAHGGNYDLEGIHVLLLIQGQARRNVIKNWLENHKAQVLAISEWELLRPTLEHLKFKISHASVGSSSRVIDNNYFSEYDGQGLMGGELEASSSRRRRQWINFRSKPACLLLVVDVASGPVLELCSVISNVSQDIEEVPCLTVWLAGEILAVDMHAIQNHRGPQDIVFQKPFHGSRLYAALDAICDLRNRGIQRSNSKFTDIEEACLSSTYVSMTVVSGDSSSTKPAALVDNNENGVVRDEKPLDGLRVLIAEDNALLRRLAITTLSKLGALVESCTNGKDALRLVSAALKTLKNNPKQKDGVGPSEVSGRQPFHFILMDCEMPEMNGYDATTKIREEERYYGDGHIPIIALSAHAMEEQACKSIQSGMDFHMVKPLNEDKLLEVVRKFVVN